MADAVGEPTTTTPNVRVLADAEQLSRAAAEDFIRIAADTVAERRRFTVVLSGGSTPRRLYEVLAEPSFYPRVEWHKVEFFWGDERTVPPNHAESNYRMAAKALLNRLAVSKTQTHRMPAERRDLEGAAREYQTDIARVLGVNPDGNPPRFDLVLLGMGADGHIASLFPYTEALREPARWVIANYVPQLNSHRLTLTTRIINRARHILFLIAGRDKAAPLAEVLEGPRDPDRLPAQFIRPVNGDVTWLVDELAANQLSPSLHGRG